MKAFVAMKFDDNFWKDKRYIAISDVLSGIGYSVVRADQIKTSGKVVDEVCQLFKESDIVVIDTTGDSHSVSYEVGYCHGIERDPATTLLIRKEDENPIPFNYRHFRLQIYRDTRHLKQLIRYYFDVPKHTTGDTLGLALSFSHEDVTMYGLEIANIVLDAFSVTGVSGRIDYYGADVFFMPNTYVIGIGPTKFRKPLEITFRESIALRDAIESRLSKGIVLNRSLCELTMMSNFYHSFLELGSILLIDGKVSRVMRETDQDLTWFLSAAKAKLGEE